MEPDAGVEVVIKAVDNYQIFYYQRSVMMSNYTKRTTLNGLKRIYN